MFLLHLYLLQYFDDFHQGGKKNTDLVERFLNNSRFLTVNSFVLNMQIHFVTKIIICIAIVEIHPKTLMNI